jgi:hypothetical protein
MPQDPVLTDIATRFDAMLQQILVDGGVKVLVNHADGTSEIEVITPPASILSVIERRLHHNGAVSLTKANGQSALGDTFARLAREGKIRPVGGDLPALSEKDDLATRTG